MLTILGILTIAMLLYLVMTKRTQSDYDILREKVTAKRVKEWFGTQVKAEVIRYELPRLGALNFVMKDALNGGVTSALSIDKHGKCLSSHLLEMSI